MELKNYKSYKTPAGTDLFGEEQTEPLNDKIHSIFHCTVAKALILSKHTRPDIQPVVAVLCT